MLRVATVLSAREWESRLVAAARESAMVKLVLRAFVPDEVSSHASGLDVVVVGAETPWVTPTRVASWRRLGLRVVGLHARSDRPAAERLHAGGADLVLTDDLDPGAIMREIRVLEAGPTAHAERAGRLVVVTGVHGAPGVSEIALALAWNSAGRRDTVLFDGDLSAPSLAVRLGLPPRPDLGDVVDQALSSGEAPIDRLPRVGSLRVVPGALRMEDIALRADVAVDVAVGFTAERDVVVDAGRWPTSERFVREADSAIVVTGVSPVAIVRLARLVEEWVGPRPHLVVNGITPARRLDVIAAIRRWSGLEPAAIVPRSRRLAMASVTAAEPTRMLRRRLIGVGVDDDH